ncbi:hypothetical protein KC19_2G172700 [Ceratodon purpureus]|uniref:WW domain-containing protein n=1 Tax=Ceratodon purpureus TaxID=3225 RepID=A0A8T0IWR8_CERPU|nr:hypothetical protein KC19_2G172700 [Ceratodon purpureus]
MAVAMETGGWRGGEILDVKKKRTAWGADAQQLMQMMMGQLHSEPENVRQDVELSTLDLLGKADPCSSSREFDTELHLSASPDFLELDPEEPLPSGWEKCLDLKTGKVSYVDKNSGLSTSNDPRKRNCSIETELQTQFSPLAAHEFLGSKRSETLRQENSLRASSSSSSGSPRLSRQQNTSRLRSFTTGKQLWNLQADDRHVSLANRCDELEAEEESNLELDLNLAAGGSSSPSLANRHEQTVCTMEMIQNALKRTAEKASITIPISKREMPRLQQKLSMSSSFSSLTSTRSDPIDSGVVPSPSTSSSSSTSSRSRKAASLNETRQSTGACEGDSKVDSGALVMGACTRCLMYVMLKRDDPRCPRCESEVPVDFSAPPCKRSRVISDRR